MLECYHRPFVPEPREHPLSDCSMALISNLCHDTRRKMPALAHTLLSTFTAQLGSQRERVVGEFGGPFGGDRAEFFPLISG